MTAVAMVSLGMLVLAALLTTVHVARSRDLPDRAIGIDMIVALLLNGLAVDAALRRDDLTVPLVLLIGLLAFLGTVAVARYIERRGL